MSKLALLSNIERAMNGLWNKAVALFATKGEVAKKADKVHNHDDRYFTEAEMNTKLAGKADTSHNHNTVYYTKGEVDTKVDGKANVSHNHDTRYHRVDLPIITSGDINGYYTSNGTYSISSSATITGAPYTGAIYGMLTVFIRSTGDVIQHFTDYTGKEYTRHRNSSNSTWSVWTKVFSSAQKPTWEEVIHKPGSFPPASHNHDDMYYTESEMNTKLAGKADTTHNHNTVYYTKGEVDTKVDAKANVSHNHDTSYFKKVPVRLAGSEDLNTITNPDNYVIASANIKNSPRQYGRMVVLGWSDSNKWVTQIFYADVSNEMYVRCSTNATATSWTPWAKMFNSTFKPTWGEIDGKPSTFTPATHTHDDRYFTESEMNTKLAAKADTSHTHNYLPSGVTITKEGEDFYINY